MSIFLHISFIAFLKYWHLIPLVQAGFYTSQANTRDSTATTAFINDIIEFTNVFSTTECLLKCERISKRESFLTTNGKCLCADEFKMMAAGNSDGASSQAYLFQGQLFQKVDP